MTESSDREGGPRLERSPSSSSGWSSYSDASYDEQLLRQEEDELNERAMRNQDLHRQAVQEEYARMELGFGSSRVVVVNKLEWERLCALCPANTSTRRRRRPPQEGQRRNGACGIHPLARRLS